MTKKSSGKSASKVPPASCQLIGATVVGERGQVVIPKDIRDRLSLHPGAKLIVMQHGDSPVMFLPVEQMEKMIRQMSEYVARMSKPARSKLN